MNFNGKNIETQPLPSKGKADRIVSTKPLHGGQRRIANDIKSTNARFNTIRCSRQFGKTYFGEQLLLFFSLNKKYSENKTKTGKCINMWVSPTISQSKKVFRSVSAFFKKKDVLRYENKTDLLLVLKSGVTIVFKGVDKPDNIRGESISYMFCDEFAFYKTDVWDEVLRPMLNVQGIRAFFFSTPKGKHNSFYQLDTSTGDNYASHYGNYKENPYYDKSEVEDARKRLPTAIFEQEYEGLYVDDGGEVFRDMADKRTVSEWQEPDPKKQYFGGIDWARHIDKAVLHIVDNFGNTAYIQSIGGTSWGYIIDSFAATIKKYNAYVIAEANSIGDVLNEQLKLKCGSVEEFVTTNASKKDIVELGISSISDNNVKFVTDDLYREFNKQMEIFTFEYLPKSGLIRYAAPDGEHDDEVISWCLANKARHENMYSGIIETHDNDYRETYGHAY